MTLCDQRNIESILKDFDRKLRHAFLADGTFRVTANDLGNSQIQLTGNIIAPHFIPREYAIHVNGKPLLFQNSQGENPGMNERLQPFYLLRPNFEALIDDVNIYDITQPMEINAVAKNGSHSFPWFMRSWLGPSWGPLPEPEFMKRVGIPDGNIPASLITGASWHYKLRQLLKIYFNKDLDACERILDWGCGYGRLIRFFAPAMRSRVYGADIDPVNIAYAQNAHPTIQFSHVPMQPPMPYDNEFFDVVYGGSIFTHLAEADQFLWLAELQRVTKPGGCVAVTVHARQSWAQLGFHNSDAILPILERGFKQSNVPNPDLLDVAGDFYTDVHHDYNYIITEWWKYFEVLDILEGYYGAQAMVVMRRR